MFLEKRGLTYSFLEDVEVLEVICGVSSTEDIENFHEWITKQHLRNQENLDSRVISMDIEDVKASYYDVMCMPCKIVIFRESQLFQRHLDVRSVSDLLEDS